MADKIRVRGIENPISGGPHLRALVIQLSGRPDFSSTRLVQSICSNSEDSLIHFDAIMNVSSLERLALDRSYSHDEHMAKWIEMTGSTESAQPKHTFASLRALRLSNIPSNPEAAQALLESSLNNGTLRAFDINFEELGLNTPVSMHLEYLGGFNWLKGAESIRNLGVRNFVFQTYSFEQEQALPEFLGSFPHLETLHIESAHYTPAQLSLMILNIMMKTKALKIVYAPGLLGAALDSIRTEAQNVYGVQVVPAREPRVWPVPLEEE